MKKETIDKFVNTFISCPVIIDHKDNITETDKTGIVNKVWFSPEDGWYWCSGVITDKKATELIKKGYNVSCQYAITEYADNTEDKLHNANPYDKEILNGVFEHLAIVENPRYEDAFIAVNAYIACNEDENTNNEDDIEWITVRGTRIPIKKGQTKEEAVDEFLSKIEVNPHYEVELKQVLKKAKENPNERQNLNIGKVSDKLKQEAEKHGFNIKGYTHEMDVSGVRHSFKQHGDEKREENRGQIAITDKDFEKIPEIIYEPDSIDFSGKNKTGLETITYKKAFSDGTVAYIEEIRTGKKTLTINTMYKHKKTGNPRTSANNSNPLSNASIYIIPYLETDFNPNEKIEVARNKYTKVFDYIKNCKGESMDNETKGLFASLVEALKARNEAEEDEAKKEKDKDEDKF